MTDDSLNPGVPGQPQGDAGIGRPPVPAMPAVAASSLHRGAPDLLVEYGQRHSIGWQDTRRAGPVFVVVRFTAMDTPKVVERFPLTENGWSEAWHALVSLDRDAARAAAARLEARAAAARVKAELARLDDESVCCLPGVVFLGGAAAGAGIAVGTPCDLRFLDDRLGIFPRLAAQVLLEIPYRDMELVDVGGPELVKKWSPGQQAGLAIAFGLPGALLGLGETKIQTIVRIRTADFELFFLCMHRQPDALRNELSVPLDAIRDAQSAPAAPSGQSAADRLSELASMLDAGQLTLEEFDHLKAAVIAES